MAEAADAVWLPVLPSMKGFGPALISGGGKAAQAGGATLAGRLSKGINVGLAAMGAGAAIAGTVLYRVGSVFDDVRDTIAAGTGAIGDDLDSMVDSAKNVGKQIPANFDDISESISSFNTLTGATDKVLEELTTSTLEASRILGEDGVANSEAFGKAMKQWQIPAEEGPGQMDMLFKATQKYGVGLGEISGHLTTYGSVLQNAGFDMQESTDLFGQLEAGGIDVSRVMPGLNKAFRNWSSEGKNSREEFDKTVDAMKNAETETDALNIATEAFGAEGANRLTTAVRNGSVSLDDLGSSLDGADGLIAETSENTKSFAEQWMLFKNNVLVLLEPLADKVFSALSDGMKWVTEDLMPQFLAGWTGEGGAVTAIEKLGSAARTVFGWIGDHKGLFLGLAAGLVAAKVAMVGYSVAQKGIKFAKNAAGWAKETVRIARNTAAKVASAGQTLALKAMYAKDWVVTQARSIAGWVRETAVMLAHKTASIASAAATKAMALGQKALNLVMRLNPIGLVVTALVLLVGAVVAAYKKFDWFKNFVDTVWDGLKAGASWMWDNLKKIFNWVKDGISGVGTFFKAAGAVIAKMWEDISKALGDGWNWIKRNVFNPLKTAFGAVKKFFGDRIKDILKFWKDFKSGLKVVWTWIKSYIFTPIKNAFKVVANFFRDRIRDILKFWDNFKRGLKLSWNWIKDYVFTPFKNAFGAVKDFFSNRINDIKGYWSNLKNNLKAGYDWIKRNVFNKFRDGLSWLGNQVRNAKNRIGDLWDSVKDKFAQPINWVIRNVWNDGIKRVFQAVVDVIPGLNVSIPNVSEIRTRAKGGYTPAGWTLVGEEGPELVNFPKPSRVYTAEETQAALSGRAENPAQQFSESNPAHGGWWNDRWQDVQGGARWVKDGVKDVAGNVLKWVRGGLAKAAEAVLNPMRSMLGDAGSGAFGDLLGGGANWGFDKVIDWLQGEDDKSLVNPDTGGRNLTGALSYVNAAAFSIADAIQPGMFMQAFNQSMMGAHGQGRAVDFMAKNNLLQATYDYMVANAAQLNGINEVIYNYRRWTPSGGERPLRGGVGNDPGHVWHVHGQWPAQFDGGGLLKPGMAAYHSPSMSKPDKVLTDDHWNTLSSLAADGSSMPDTLAVYDVDNVLIGTMQVQANRAMEGASAGTQRSTRKKGI